MVATIQVLTSPANDVAKYFVPDGASRYYATELPGQWHGRGAGQLRYSGEVTTEAFQHILAGQRADGTRLTRKWSAPKSQPEKTRCPGYDLTFSAPKSVSILWAFAGPALRAEIESILDDAVKMTLDALEQHIPLGRRGKGSHEAIHGGLVVAMFRHFTNREQEPQLHVHALISNCLYGADGRWSAVNSRELHKWTPALGRVFRCNIAQLLRERMGTRLYRPELPNGKLASWFEVKGIPASLIKALSSRKQAIDAQSGGIGARTGKAAAKARERANLRTRKKKEKSRGLDELLQDWQRIGQEHGVSSSSIKSLLGNRIRKPSSNLISKTLLEAVEEITEHDSHFAARQVVSLVCEKLQHRGCNGTESMKHVHRELDRNPEIIPLEKLKGEFQYTTRSMWQAEEKLFADVNQLRTGNGATLRNAQIERAIAAKPTLFQEQATATRKLLSQTSQIRNLTGLAGAGKSYTLDAVRDGFERAGYTVIGGALSGAAKEELVRQSGITSRTLASYLYHFEKGSLQLGKEKLGHVTKQLVRAGLGWSTWKRDEIRVTRKTVLIVDESAMVGTRMLGQLVEHIKRAGATLILVGDPHQLSPIEAGSPAKYLGPGLNGAKLSTNRRQKLAADREAVAAIREGDGLSALKNYAKRGQLSVAKDRDELMQQVVKAWAMSGGRERPQDHVIFAQTRADAGEINRRCQQERMRARTRFGAKAIKIASQRYYQGDRVLFHAPFRRKFIENGYAGTVVATDRGKVTIRLDRPPSKKDQRRGASQVVTLTKSDAQAAMMSLGYSSTTHKLQGQTVPNSYLLLSGAMTDREMAYTQATRGSHSVRLFVDADSAGKDLTELTKDISRSRAKRMAHEIKRKSPTAESCHETTYNR